MASCEKELNVCYVFPLKPSLLIFILYYLNTSLYYAGDSWQQYNFVSSTETSLSWEGKDALPTSNLEKERMKNEWQICNVQ